MPETDDAAALDLALQEVAALGDDVDDDEDDTPTQIIHRDAECPEMVRFDDQRLKAMTPEELRGHIRILYMRQDQFIEHFGRLHRIAWSAKGYNPSQRGPQRGQG